MKQPNQKMKLLYIMKILLENTDEEHFITVPNIIEILKNYGIDAERKSVYDDLECLRAYGIDICTNKTKTNNYFVASREFEIPELKLLIDSVQSSKFITHKKSEELISKIEKLTSRENAKKLQRQVFITNRVKTPNEKIYYNVDTINDAIACDKQILFKYFHYNENKQKIYGKDGGLYKETPVSLTWDDENYYLITYKEKYEDFAHYRVDKMESITILDEKRVMPEQEFDLSKYAKSVFAMYSGEKTDVTIQFENELAGVVFDRFGIDINIIKSDDKHFICNTKVAVSPHFLTWIMSFGRQAKIIYPKNIAQQMYEMAKEIVDVYE